MESPPEQLPMFEIPEMYRPPKRRDPGLAPKWSKFIGHATCDLCIMNIHDGITDTPLSKAKMRYTMSARVWLLCTVHAGQVRNGERRLHG